MVEKTKMLHHRGSSVHEDSSDVGFNGRGNHLARDN